MRIATRKVTYNSLTEKKNYGTAHHVSCEQLESVNISIARKIQRNEAEKDASREAAVRYRVK